MQPSEHEIQREVENLRDIRRRSTAQGGPGALILDPDLPAQTHAHTPPPPHANPQTAYYDDSSSDSHSHEDSAEGTPADDPFHLFWVPARMHPEIDPGQFRAFLKEHARAPSDGPGATLGRAGSTSSLSSALGRKKSMLSRQYKPSEHDGVEDERVVPLRRNKSSLYHVDGPQLTIGDLERLDELAEEASKSSDPSKLRSVLRRSLSMNMAPSVIDQMDNIPDMGDEADSPIIVPRPGQILRRAARTKIRKPGQTGEGSHRFNATRRGPGARAATTGADQRTSSDLSSSDHGDSEPRRERALSNESFSDDGAPRLVRPESYSVETFIFDSYVTDENTETDILALATTLELPEPPEPVTSPVEEPHILRTTSPPPMLPLEPPLTEPVIPSPILQHPQPTRPSLDVPAPIEVPSRTPSPERASSPISEAPSQARPSLSELSPVASRPSSQIDHRKEKDKKGLFGKWGGEKKGKKEKEREREKEKEKEREREREREREKEKEKEKETGFFGSFFGSKKKQEESSPGLGHGAGRETAAALLGASKSKSAATSPSPQPIAGNYARYPIHVERAIYRLSHIKLANPRRPLYEQVLISNLMFWYLGVINKAQTQGPGADAGAGAVQGPSPAEKERREREQREKEEHERAAKEAAEREAERERVERLEQKAQGRRGSLTKAPTAGSPASGNRRAEMPVRGPQYDLQHRAMEQEYGYPGGYANGPPSPYPSSPQSPQSPHSQSPSQLVHPQPQVAQSYYGSPGNTPVAQQPPRSASPSRAGAGSPKLPPGAMPPPEREQGWQVPAQRTMSSPSPPSSPPTAVNANSHPRRSRSPPPPSRHTHGAHNSAKVPGRSLSATAVAAASGAPPAAAAAHPMNGKSRKATSAHATVPHNLRRPRTSEASNGEEEDMPLAMWQQQQRQR